MILHGPTLHTYKKKSHGNKKYIHNPGQKILGIRDGNGSPAKFRGPLQQLPLSHQLLNCGCMSSPSLLFSLLLQLIYIF
jgi:hypothetical protein